MTERGAGAAPGAAARVLLVTQAGAVGHALDAAERGTSRAGLEGRAVGAAAVREDHQRVAVGEVVPEVFDSLSDKRVVLCGAGEMGEETLRYLKQAGATDICILNRSFDRKVGSIRKSLRIEFNLLVAQIARCKNSFAFLPHFRQPFWFCSFKNWINLAAKKANVWMLGKSFGVCCEPVWADQHIIVSPNDVGTAGVGDGCVAADRVSLLSFKDINDGQIFGELFDHLLSVVGRIVVDNDDFPLEILGNF